MLFDDFWKFWGSLLDTQQAYEQKSETAICSYGLFDIFGRPFCSIWSAFGQFLESEGSFLTTF